MTDNEEKDKNWRSLLEDMSMVQRVQLIMLKNDLLRDEWEATDFWMPERAEEMRQKRNARIAIRAAESTGTDPEQFIDQYFNADTRTPAQREAVLSEIKTELDAGKLVLQRSRFVQALKTLEPLKGKYPDKGEAPAERQEFDAEAEISVKEQAALIFFARHEGANPSGEADLTAADKKELKEIFRSLDRYYFEKTEGGKLEADGQLFLDYINQQTTDADQIITALPQLKAILPTQHTMPNNKLANTLPKDIVNTGAWDLTVGRKGHEDLTSYVMATLSDQDTGNIVMTGRPYTEYDRSVMDSIVSLWKYGDKSHTFTPDMVYRTMNHKTETEKVTPQQKAAVTKSIEKMRRIHVTIDATREAQAIRATDADGNPVTSFRYDDFLLSAKHIEVEAGGKTVSAYKLNTEPVLLTYSLMTRQLVTINAKYLDVKEVDKAGKLTPVSLANTEQRIPVRDYLLRRIAVMKNDRKNERARQSNRIKFETLFADTGTNAEKKQYAANTRNYTFQVLDFLKASSFIEGYKVVKDGRSIIGVDIIL